MPEHALCIGNFTVDLTPDGETPGGSVYYSGATFAALESARSGRRISLP